MTFSSASSLSRSWEFRWPWFVRSGRARTVVGLLLWGLFCYAFVYLVEGQSRAAWLAFIVALLLTSAVAFFSKRRVPVSRLAVAAAVFVSFANADLISSRAGAERIVLGAASADWLDNAERG